MVSPESSAHIELAGLARSGRHNVDGDRDLDRNWDLDWNRDAEMREVSRGARSEAEDGEG